MKTFCWSLFEYEANTFPFVLHLLYIIGRMLVVARSHCVCCFSNWPQTLKKEGALPFDIRCPQIGL